MAQYKNIDIVPDETITRVHLSQGDIGRTLIFYLFENALSWSVPASSTIKCQGTKPSGFGFSVSCTYSGNAVTCVTTDEMTDEYGQIEAELVITSSDESQVFGTSNFILDIEKNPHPSSTEDGNIETAIALTARITALESAVGDIDDLETEADDLVGAINEIASGSGSSSEGLTDDIKQALLQLASKVAYIDDDGQDYYDALEDALYPPVELASITCVYTQSDTVYPTTSLDSLKSDLVVTAHMTDSSTSVVSSSSYVLSGTLSVGTSTVTVTYGGKTTTFNVTVTALPTLSSISAVYTQSGTVYTTDTLDSLKADLVVTATYSDSSTATVASSDYTLSGTLTEGTSTITVSYEGKTTTFTVTVTVKPKLTVPWIGCGGSSSHTVTNNDGVYTLGYTTADTVSAQYYQCWKRECTQGDTLHLDFNNDDMVSCGVYLYVIDSNDVILQENAVSNSTPHSGDIDSYLTWITTGFSKNVYLLDGDSSLTIPATGYIFILIRGAGYVPDSQTSASTANLATAVTSNVFDFWIE